MHIQHIVEHKFCHCRAGDVVALDSNISRLFLVARVDDGMPKIKNLVAIDSLYKDEENIYFLVDLETGEVIKPPHLSSRIRKVSHATLVASL